MPQASELKPSTRFFGLFVGRSGDGKTCAESSFPGPLHIFDSDMRIRGLLGSKDFNDLSQITYDTFDPDKGFKEYESKLEALGTMFKGGQKPYSTICIDSVTTMTRLFVTDAIAAAGDKIKKRLTLKMPGPQEYGYEAEATMQIFDYLRSLSCHVIVTAHIVDRFGKLNKSEEYSETGVIGEKLTIRDKLGENILLYFDEVYRFSRSEDGKRYSVEFHSDIAKTAYGSLPFGKVDITGKNFYKYWKEQVEKI